MRKIFLLADDDSDDKEVFCEALEAIDPSIICYYANDGREALEILDNNRLDMPHLIFLDINMPGMNGWQCLANIKCHPEFKNIPVLIYSTSSHQREANIAIDLGALCFFTKPVDFNELKNILRVVVNNVDGDLLEAIENFNAIKSKKVFNCTDED